MADGLIDDLRSEIASNVPAKAALKIRVTSKDFRRIVDGESFPQLQARNHKKTTGFFVQRLNELPRLITSEPRTCGVPDMSLSYLVGFEPLVNSSSRGLLCVRGQLASDPYLITNPVTQETHPLPPIVHDHHISATIQVNNDFPAHYTVVCPFRTEVTYHLHVYSSETAAWYELDSGIDASIDVEWASGTVCNNMIFWRGNNEIISYSVSDKVVREWPVINFKRGAILGTVNGDLVSSVVETNWFGKCIAVYSLVHEEDGSWRSNSLYRKKLTNCGMNLLQHAKVLSISDKYAAIDTTKKFIILSLETGDLLQVLIGKTQQGMSQKVIPYVNSFMDFVR